MWHMGDGWGWWMGFGSIWMVGLWAIIIWAVFSLTKRGSADTARGSADPGTAMEILERRYARGELNDEQYEAMRARLSQPSVPMPAVASAPDQGSRGAASTPLAGVGARAAAQR